MKASSGKIPLNSPMLVKLIMSFSAFSIVLSFLVNMIYGIVVGAFLKTSADTLYLALAGIAATLAGFIIAGIAIVSTVLSKPDFSRSPLKKYYSQVYNSFKSAVNTLIVVIVLGVVLAIFPEENEISNGAFYVTLYLFFSALILMWYSIDLIGNILTADSEGAIEKLHADKIQHTDLPTGEDGSLYNKPD